MKNHSKLMALRALDSAVSTSSSEIDKRINAARRQNPAMSDQALLRVLERSYFSMVTASGASAGGIAALPGPGQVGGVVVAVADAGAFTTATGAFIFSVASVHGIPVDDIERRKALLLSILTGPHGPAVVRKMAGRTGSHWGRRVVQGIPIASIRQINKVLGHNFVTRYGTRQGILVLGKCAPFGIGAAIGATGNGLMAAAVIKATRSAFGPPTLGPRPQHQPFSPSPTDFAAAA